MTQPVPIPISLPLLLLLFFPGILTLAPAAAGHPFHSTFTEMEWNQTSGRFEVAVQLPGLQIDDELSRLHRRRINLESSEDSERLLQEYITSRFKATGKGREGCHLHWAGMEIDERNVWAYFELELSGNSPKDSVPEATTDSLVHHTLPEELTIECRFLIDSQSGQANLITLIDGLQRTSTLLTAHQPVWWTNNNKGVRSLF